MVVLIKIVAIADLTHFPLNKCTGFGGFYLIFFFSDVKILVFFSLSSLNHNSPKYSSQI